MKKLMKKATQNYIVFGALLILGLIETVSGFVLWLVLSGGGGWRGGRGSLTESTFMSLSRHDWLDIHDWVAVIIMAVVIIHIALHWKWIVYLTKRILQSGKTVAATSAQSV